MEIEQLLAVISWVVTILLAGVGGFWLRARSDRRDSTRLNMEIASNEKSRVEDVNWGPNNMTATIVNRGDFKLDLSRGRFPDVTKKDCHLIGTDRSGDWRRGAGRQLRDQLDVPARRTPNGDLLIRLPAESPSRGRLTKRSRRT